MSSWEALGWALTAGAVVMVVTMLVFLGAMVAALKPRRQARITHIFGSGDE